MADTTAADESGKPPMSPQVRSAAEYTRTLLQDEAELSALMSGFGYQAERPARLPQTGVFCTRELDFNEIEVFGYDMDYTLIDYNMILLEERVYHYSKAYLQEKGFPVSDLQFNHDLGAACMARLRQTLRAVASQWRRAPASLRWARVRCRG